MINSIKNIIKILQFKRGLSLPRPSQCSKTARCLGPPPVGPPAYSKPILDDNRGTSQNGHLRVYSSIILLAILVIINAYIHRSELTIKSDPNDNIFQYALVDEAQVIWREVLAGKLSPFYLFDSYNERWNEGFALSNYYSHLPQAVIALTSIATRIDAYVLFNWLKFLLLVLLPMSFFAASLIIGLSRMQALLAAYISHIIITDGLYGIDITSFLWRGWGLSSQLLAVFLLPLAFAYSFVYLAKGKHLVKAIFFNILVAQAHPGIFLMLCLSYLIIFLVGLFFSGQAGTVTPSSQSVLSSLRAVWDPLRSRHLLNRLVVLFCLTGFFLAYYLVPFFLQSDWRNYSYWDPMWKFDSFGLSQVIVWFFNGSLFDFGRFPFVTLLIFFGALYGLIGKNNQSHTPREPRHAQVTPGESGALYFNLLWVNISILFIVYMIFFIGRNSPFGWVINLIPGFSEFHLHRFIVMVQFIGVFCAVGLVAAILNEILSSLGLRPPEFRMTANGNGRSERGTIIGAFLILIGLGLIFYLEQPLLKYSQNNRELITQSNVRYRADEGDYSALRQKLKSLPPARVYAGRPGNWGREFKVGDTPVYMALSRDGLPVVGFAPESWSPNAEYDQFYDESREIYYQRYNVRYALFPKSIKAPSFAKYINTYGKYILYEVKTGGYFEGGTSSTVVSGKKTNFTNITHWWMTSKGPENGEYPAIRYNTRKITMPGKNHTYLTSLNSYYENTGNEYTIWERPPLYLGKKEAVKPEMKFGEIADLTYRAKFTVPENCFNCIIVLKQTYHPNWQVTVNEERITPFPVFPFYIGINAGRAGEYSVEAVYRPGRIKVVLIISELVVIFAVILGRIKKYGK